jgi:hypothetical protein
LVHRSHDNNIRWRRKLARSLIAGNWSHFDVADKYFFRRVRILGNGNSRKGKRAYGNRASANELIREEKSHSSSFRVQLDDRKRPEIMQD